MDQALQRVRPRIPGIPSACCLNVSLRIGLIVPFWFRIQRTLVYDDSSSPRVCCGVRPQQSLVRKFYILLWSDNFDFKKIYSRIIVLDSLAKAFNHSKDVLLIQKWLNHMAGGAPATLKTLNVKVVKPKVHSSLQLSKWPLNWMQVPQQPNFIDCGIYCLHFLKTFLQDPSGIGRVLEVSPLSSHVELSFWQIIDKIEWLANWRSVGSYWDSRT